MTDGPILISGAGVVGLTLAQSLRRLKIPFIIFDRDEHVNSRGQGWGITLHWALQYFLDLIPQELHEKVFKAQVIPNFDTKDTGAFLYLDASTCNTLVQIPPSKRLRVRREEIRQILLEGIDVQWANQTSEIEITDDGVKVTCKNGQIFRGSTLFGTEGSNSLTRRFLCPENYALNQLPIRFCGASIKLSSQELAEYQALDPLLFQGTVPFSNTFFWFSLLSTPEYNGSENEYVAQANLSWPTSAENWQPMKSKEDLISAIRAHSKGLAPLLQKAVDKITDNSEAIEIRLADWPCLEWDNHEGRISLLGDAAHSMTMYRGEAANHGICDVYELIQKIKQVGTGEPESLSWAEAIKEFETQMRNRAAPAVLLSRQACLDAHDWNSLTSKNRDHPSPLLSLRKNTGKQ